MPRRAAEWPRDRSLPCRGTHGRRVTRDFCKRESSCCRGGGNPHVPGELLSALCVCRRLAMHGTASREKVGTRCVSTRAHFVIAGMRGDARDRKSTRLNSSHSQISYAV